MKTSKLEKFLINRNLLEKFEHNRRQVDSARSLSQFLKSCITQDTQITEAFEWERTAEGRVFWVRLEKEWWECLRTNRL